MRVQRILRYTRARYWLGYERATDTSKSSTAMVQILKISLLFTFWCLALSCCHLCNLARAEGAESAVSHDCCGDSAEDTTPTDNACGDFCHHFATVGKTEIAIDLATAVSRHSSNFYFTTPTIVSFPVLSMVAVTPPFWVELGELSRLRSALVLSANAPPIVS